MAARAPTLVFYHVPADKDDTDAFNAFPIPKPVEEIKLKDIRSRFPLPGVYHFRFKMKFDTGFVWVDVTNDDANIPSVDRKIYSKVSRISWEGPSASSQAAPTATVSSSSSQSNVSSTPTFAPSSVPIRSPSPAPAAAPAPAPAPVPAAVRSTSPAPAPVSSSSSASKPADDDPFGLFASSEKPKPKDAFDLLF